MVPIAMTAGGLDLGLTVESIKSLLWSQLSSLQMECKI